MKERYRIIFLDGCLIIVAINQKAYWSAKSKGYLVATFSGHSFSI
jgi:hypothetical protein